MSVDKITNCKGDKTIRETILVEESVRFIERVQPFLYPSFGINVAIPAI